MERTARSWILFAGPDVWRLAPLPAAPAEIPRLDAALDAPPEEVAQAVADLAGPAVLTLALGSTWCLCATIDNQPSSRHWRNAMLYELEQQLPMPAEQIVADYAVSGDSALAIAADLRRLRPLVAAMQDRSISVEGIYPAVFLAVGHLQNQRMIGSADALLFAEAGQVALVQLEASGNVPVDWHWMAADADIIADRLPALSDAPQSVLTCGLTDAMNEALSARLAIPCTAMQAGDDEPGDLWALAAAGAWEAHRGQLRPPINLARESLASKISAAGRRRAARFALVAALVLAVVFNAAIMFRSYRYGREIAHQQAEQRRHFAQVLHGEPPRLVALRMESEYRALVRQKAEGATAGGSPLVLRMVWEVFQRLPNDQQTTIKEVQFDDGAVKVVGEAANEAAVRQLAARLAGKNPVQYDSPHMRPAGNGRVVFTLTGRWSTKASAKEENRGE